MTEPTPFQAVILSFLAPILAAGTATARLAIEAYKPTGEDQFLTIAQIVGFGLTGLDTLRLSMPEDLSPTLKLKLRGNANALSKSARLASFTLNDQRRAAEPPAPEQDDDAPQILAALETVRAEVKAARPTDTNEKIDIGWADAMTDVAAEFTAELAHLPAKDRSLHLRRISALTETARTLRRGDVPLKSRLLGSTSLRS
jgi:hypothetical protein